MKRSTALLATTALAFALIGTYVGAKRTPLPAPASPAVISLLSQTLTDSRGTPQALAQWKGKRLLVNFWAPWCKPCVEEMPELSALQTSAAGKNIQIIGIGIDSASNIAEFSTKLAISYPVYVAGMSGTELASALGNQIGGLPYTVLIDANGQVKKTYSGRLRLDELRKDLASL